MFWRKLIYHHPPQQNKQCTLPEWPFCYKVNGCQHKTVGDSLPVMCARKAFPRWLLRSEHQPNGTALPLADGSVVWAVATGDVYSVILLWRSQSTMFRISLHFQGRYSKCLSKCPLTQLLFTRLILSMGFQRPSKREKKVSQHKSIFYCHRSFFHSYCFGSGTKNSKTL